MPFDTDDYVRIGARFVTRRLLEQGGVSLKFAVDHAVDFKKKFPKKKTEELAKYLSEVKELVKDKTVAASDRSTSGADVGDRIRDAKSWIDDVLTAADNAFEEDPETGDEFHKDGKLGRSVPKVLARVTALGILAKKYLPALADWGFDADDLAKGKEVHSALDSANTGQEVDVKNLPPKTRKLYEAKARAYLLLKRLARAGRNVFKGDPATAKKLALDILHRKGRPAAKSKTGDSPATPGK